MIIHYGRGVKVFMVVLDKIGGGGFDLPTSSIPGTQCLMLDLFMNFCCNKN